MKEMLIVVPFACFQSKSAALAIRVTPSEVTARVRERTEDATKLWRFCFRTFIALKDCLYFGVD